MTNLIEVNYNQTGQSKKTNHLGMREMQQMVYEKKDSQYLLLKAPPASGKSRALMFVALDKLLHQNIKKVIVAVPEKSIGGSFMDAKLSVNGFESDWIVNSKYNLCTIESTKSKGDIFREFLQNDEKILICTHSTLRSVFETIDEKRFDNTLLAIDEFHHVSASDVSVLGGVLKSIINKSNAHIMAMTGSYFRGDAHPILLPEIEDKFEKVEEIVGNIFDEDDEIEYGIKKINENTYIANGMTNLEEISSHLNINLPLEEFDTLSGFIIGKLGSIPSKIEKPVMSYLGYEFMVLEADSKRISKVKISKTNEIFLKSSLENKSNESEK